MAQGTRGMYPNGSFGYWRGSPLAGGSGSGMGQANQGTGLLSQGLGSVTSGWEPTVLYMLFLIISEMIIFHIGGRVLK